MTFWSLTLYDHFWVLNALNRFSVGTKSQAPKLGDDGSLTIYVQAESSGKDKESNWLPAPKDAGFSLYSALTGRSRLSAMALGRHRPCRD